MNVCPNCRAPLPPGTRFCGQCGAAADGGVPAKKQSSCLKIFVYGCLFTVVAAIILLAASGYIAKKWAGDLFGTENSKYGKRIKALNEENRFQAPADGIITQEQLNRFLSAIEEFVRVRNRHEAEFQEFERKMKDSNYPYIDGLRFWWNVGDQLRQAFVGGLEKEHMSLDEYRYIHRAVVKAYMANTGEELQQTPEVSGLNDIPDEQLKQIYEEAKQVPSANLQLIRNEKERLDRLLPSAPMARVLFPLLTLDDSNLL
jgi:zinc-ribbon domain